MRLLGALVLGCLAGCLAGCVTRELRASPAALEAARALLRAGQPAKVKTLEDGLVPVTPAQRVVIVDTANKRFDLSIAEIVRDCEDHPEEANRLCELHGVQHVVVGTERKVREAVYLAPIGFVVVGSMLGAVIGIGYCAAECDNTIAKRSSQVAVGAMIVGLGYIILRRGAR